MRTLASAAVGLGLFALAASASAQEVTRMPEATRNAVGLEAGLESGFVTRGAYTRRLALGVLRDERFVGHVTWPFLAPDLGDFSLDAGAQATVLAAGDVRLALRLGGVLKNTVNDLYAATALGLGATLLFGYEGSRFGIGAELGHQQLLATHLRHSQLYRDIAHPSARSGWYAATGNTSHLGLRGGVRFGDVEIAARGGLSAVGFFQPGTPPFYATLGASYAF